MGAVAHRYADFDLYQEINHPLSIDLGFNEDSE